MLKRALAEDLIFRLLTTKIDYYEACAWTSSKNLKEYIDEATLRLPQNSKTQNSGIVFSDYRTSFEKADKDTKSDVELEIASVFYDIIPSIQVVHEGSLRKKFIPRLETLLHLYELEFPLNK